MYSRFLIITFSYFISFVENSPMILNVNDNEDELVAVISISRHGDRSPLISFPKDEFYNTAYWPMGLGQLTQKGIKRHYNLGKWFRKRYNNFLSDIYSPDEIYACSTNTDRTLMSASANLAGLYPPKKFQVWNKDIPWQPIPVHISDFLSMLETKGCEKYEKLLKEAKKSIYHEFQEKHSNTFKFIAKNTGWETVSMDEVEFLFDVFSIYKNYNTSFIPNWATSLDQNLTKQLVGVVYEAQTHTIPMTRLKIGIFYHTVFNFFDNFVRSSTSSSKHKFLMVTAHESTLSAILNAIGAYHMRKIRYGDTVIFELKKIKTGEYYVNLLYKKKDEKLEGLIVKNCDFNCNLDEFRNKMANITISLDKWLEECDINAPDKQKN